MRLSRSHAYCLTSLVVCNKYKYFEYLFVDAKDLKDNIASKEGTIIVIIWYLFYFGLEAAITMALFINK